MTYRMKKHDLRDEETGRLADFHHTTYDCSEEWPNVMLYLSSSAASSASLLENLWLLRRASATTATQHAQVGCVISKFVL